MKSVFNVHVAFFLTSDATEMPDAMEIIFQTALSYGRNGAVCGAKHILFRSFHHFLNISDCLLQKPYLLKF